MSYKLPEFMEVDAIGLQKMKKNKTSSAQAEAGAAFSGNCYCCGKISHRHCDCPLEAKKGQVGVIANAGMAVPPVSSTVFVVSRDSATYQS